MIKSMSIDEFLNSTISTDKRKVFAVYKTKKIFTPEEIENKYCDQETEENLGEYCISSMVVLPDNDVLIGFTSTYVDTQIIDHVWQTTQITSDKIEYYKLSDIHIVDITIDFYKELEEDDECEE